MPQINQGGKLEDQPDTHRPSSPNPQALLNADEATLRDDGTIRKAHYGAGKQPWDLIVEAGYGPEFAAGNVLKYLRRTKDLEHSLQSARWYWQRLQSMHSEEQRIDEIGPATDAVLWLIKILVEDEKRRLLG